MSIELKRDIHKILIEDFSKAMGFNEKTGLLPNGEKRFSGMPFVGFRYSEQTPKHNEDFEPLTPVIFTFKGALRALKYENMRVILRHANDVVEKYISEQKAN